MSSFAAAAAEGEPPVLKSRLLAALAAATLALTPPHVAIAQSGANADAFARDRNTAVRERSKPELDPLGVRLGAFRLDPEVEVGYAWTDNVFASETEEESDAILVSRAAARLASQWSRHAVEASASIAARNGEEIGAQDGVETAFAASGRLDIGRYGFVAADVRSATEQESRVDFAPREVLAEPVEIETVSGGVTGAVQINRLRGVVRVEAADADFADARTREGGVLLQRDRSRRTYGADARAEYAVSPDASGFVAIGWRRQDYDLAPPETAFDRDSDGWRLLAGANFDLSRLVRGELAAGYQRVEYEDPRLETTDGFSASGEVEWFATPIVTVGAELAREVIEANESAASGIQRTRAGVRADWEARRNLIVSAGAAYIDDAYQNIDRQDERWRFDAGAEYQLNRTAGLALTYARFSETSSGALRGSDFDVNRVTLSLRLRR